MPDTYYPKRVIRFFGNTKYALACVAQKKITFVHASNLNDPFDPIFHLSTEFDDDYQRLLEWIAIKHLDKLSDFQEILTEENFLNLLEEIRGVVTDKLKDTFIFSTCNADDKKGLVHPKDNLYMWAHYANGHRGVAIEFDLKLLSDSVLAKNKLVNPRHDDVNDPWIEIEYRANVPKIETQDFFEYVWARGTGGNVNTARLDEVFKSLIATKSEIWDREDEWRLMWRGDETRLKFLDIPIVDDSITAIYFGCRVDIQLLEDIQFEAEQNFPNAILFGTMNRPGF